MRAWRRRCATWSSGARSTRIAGCSSKRAMASVLSSSSAPYRSSPALAGSGRMSVRRPRDNREERPTATFEPVVYARGTSARRLLAKAVPTDAVGQFRSAAPPDVVLGVLPTSFVLEPAAPGARSDQGLARGSPGRPRRSPKGVEDFDRITEGADSRECAHAGPSDHARGVGHEGRAPRRLAEAQVDAERARQLSGHIHEHRERQLAREAALRRAAAA